MSINIKYLSCDVLICGSGASGAMAGIKAHLAGADTLVVTKGPYPSGNSTKALAGYAAPFGHADARDTPDIHFGDVVRNGIGLCNQKLVKLWTTAICDLTEEMRSWGLDVIRKDGKYVQVPWEGHMYPRMINHNRVTGKYVMKCLGEKSRELGLMTLTHTIVGGLFRQGGAITGAWCFDYRNLEYYVVRAKAMILTTGGIGAMYPVGDNVSTATGEGFALAFDAGAELTGMEFSHFLPTVVAPAPLIAKFAYIPFVNGLINQSEARLLNGRGDRFLASRFPNTAEKRIKAEDLVRYIGEEILAGRGGPNGGIFLDLSNVPSAFEDDPTYARVWQLAARAGIDLRQERLELIPYPHDHVGGIRIDEYGRTNVPGLYAAGEATGSAHGASRFGGSALSDALVFGAIAAEDAASFAKTRPVIDPIETEAAMAPARLIKSWLGRADGAPPVETVASIQATASQDLSIVRNEAGLAHVFRKMDDLEETAVPNFAAKAETQKQTGDNVRMAIETMGQITLCRLMATGSLERKESRGGYFGGAYREEFPEQDDNAWLKHVVLRKAEDGSIAVRFEDPIQLDEDLPEEIAKVIATEWVAPDDDAFYAISE